MFSWTMFHQHALSRDIFYPGGNCSLLDKEMLVRETEKTETQKYPQQNICELKISANFSKIIFLMQFIYYTIYNLFYDPKAIKFLLLPKTTHTISSGATNLNISPFSFYLF